jgi:phytanoyl-CoA hydroxylase
MPRSTSLDFVNGERDVSHSQWRARIKAYTERHKHELHSPELKKGDALFWNSCTVHGAFPNRDPAFSRKSLTAHYVPSHLPFGNVYGVKPVDYQTYNGMKFHVSHPDDSHYNRWRNAVKLAAWDHPLLSRGLRRIQRLTR